MLSVTGKLIAKKGKEKELAEILSALPPIVLSKEENTLLYILHRNKANPSEFFFFEQYPTKKDFDDHLAKPYIKEAFEKFSPLLDGDVEIVEYDVLSGD